MFTVLVHFKDQAQPIKYENVKNTYQKGDFFCAYVAKEDMVYKHPVANIWRVSEEYNSQ